MKQKRLFMLGLVLVFVGITHAADILKVQNVEVASSGRVALNIELCNETTNLMGWQCDISLPEGLTLELNEKGKPAASLGERFKVTEHKISSSRLSNGGYRFIATSMDGEAIPGTTGTLFSVTLKADASMTSGTALTGTIKNIEFNTQANVKLTIADVTFSVIVSGGDTPGGDTPGGDTPGGDTPGGDTPGDDTAINMLKIADVSLTLSEDLPIDVLLDNETTNLMGWQCDISLPKGLTLVLKDNGKPAATLGKRFSTTEHSISSNCLSNGDYRFIATSMDGEAIPGTTGALFSVTLKADASLTSGTTLTGTIKNIEFNTQANKKLTFSDVQFPIVIEEVPPVITAKSYTRKYGEDNPVFEYTVDGPALEGVPEIKCEATATSPVGTYDIEVKQGTVKNKNASFVSGKLTITKAPLTITAKSYTIKQGEPLPNYEIAYSGFKNGETKSVLTKQPTISCSATSTNEPGTYTIIVSGATADNYEIFHVKGTLRIRSLVAALGDINDDGEVDVTDVVELIDMVLAGSTDSIGDINGDGEVDVTDVVELIDMVLAGV